MTTNQQNEFRPITNGTLNTLTTDEMQRIQGGSCNRNGCGFVVYDDEAKICYDVRSEDVV